jgi:hypothetical protein
MESSPSGLSWRNGEYEDRIAISLAILAWKYSSGMIIALLPSRAAQEYKYLFHMDEKHVKERDKGEQ